MTPPSILEAALPAHAPTLGVTGVLERLKALDFPIEEAETVLPSHPNWEWEISAVWRDEEQEIALQIYATHTDRELVDVHTTLGHLEEHEATALKACNRSLGISLTLPDLDPLGGFHLQIRLLQALAPLAAGVVDHSSFVARPMGWLEEAAASPVPPHPQTLWTIHAVWEGDRCWLHTHGMDRCGLLELDMVDIPREDAGTMAQLLNTAASLMLDNGVPEPDQDFYIGQDMPVVWLPVEKALEILGSVDQGGMDDRDEIHMGERGLLLTKEEGKLWGHNYGSLMRFRPLMDAHPLLYVSDMETARRTALARARLDRFLGLWRSFQETEWLQFIVKLGMETTQGGREHIWFFLNDADPERLLATCMNKPYDVPAVHEGHQGWHSRALISDWMVLGPLGQVDPEKILHLEHFLRDPENVARVEASLKED